MKKSQFNITPGEMRVLRFVIAAIFLLAVVFLLVPNFSGQKTARITLPDQTKITADLALTPAERALGLSGREALDGQHGMLFIFDQAQTPTFWMKGMKISIDIIWLQDGKIIDLDENLPIDRQLYRPSAPINQVLEVRSGFIFDHSLKIGDQLEIKLP